jgi:hypothetical protein
MAYVPLFLLEGFTQSSGLDAAFDASIPPEVIADLGAIGMPGIANGMRSW